MSYKPMITELKRRAATVLQMKMTSRTSTKHQHEDAKRRLMNAEQRADRRKEAEKRRKALEDRQWAEKMKREHEKDKRDEKLWKEQKHREKQLRKQNKHHPGASNGTVKPKEPASKPMKAAVAPTEPKGLPAIHFTNGSFIDAKPSSIGERAPAPTYSEVYQMAKDRERHGIRASEVGAPAPRHLLEGEQKNLPEKKQEELAKECRRLMMREPTLYKEKCREHKRDAKNDLKKRNREVKANIKAQYDDRGPFPGLPTWWHFWVSKKGPYRTARRENAAEVGYLLNRNLAEALATTRENVKTFLEDCLSKGVPRALVMKGYVDHLEE